VSDSLPDRLDTSDNFMTRNNRHSRIRQLAIDDMQVRAAHAACAHPYPDLARLRQLVRKFRPLLFGPGEAKGELKKRLVKMKLGERVAAVETADKMTDGQIAAKVRDYFKEHPPSVQP
jgi:hypothetical protein